MSVSRTAFPRIHIDLAMMSWNDSPLKISESRIGVFSPKTMHAPWSDGGALADHGVAINYRGWMYHFSSPSPSLILYPGDGRYDRNIFRTLARSSAAWAGEISEAHASSFGHGTETSLISSVV